MRATTLLLILAVAAASKQALPPHQIAITGVSVIDSTVLRSAAVVNSASSQPQSGQLVGQVTDSATGLPMAGAIVTATAARAIQPDARTTETDGNGRYVFSNVPAGGYYLFVKHQGYFMLGRQDRPTNGSVVVNVTGGSVVTDLRLLPYSSIAGSIVSDGGVAIPGATLRLLAQQRAWNTWGKRMIWGQAAAPGLFPGPGGAVSAEATSGADGRFRFDGVAPGDYVIEATAPSAADGRAYARSFAPGSGPWLDVRPLAVGAADRQHVDIRLAAVRAAVVRGEIIGASTPNRAPDVRLIALADGGGPTKEIRQVSAWTRSFVFDAVPTGSYLLRVYYDDAWSEEPLTIDGLHEVQVSPVLGPGLSISGTTVWEGLSAPPPPDTIRRVPPQVSDMPTSEEDLRRFAVEWAARTPLQLAEVINVDVESPVNEFRMVLTADGRVRSEGLALRGRIMARTSRLLDGWYLKSALINGRDAVVEPVEISSSVTGAVFTFTRDVGEVRGHVVAQGGDPDSADVLLFTTDSRQWPGLFAGGYAAGPAVEVAFCDERGDFRFADITPGEYYLTTTDDVEDLDEAMLLKLTKTATRIRVTAGQPVVRTLTRPQ